jgi:hypothetical protein
MARMEPLMTNSQLTKRLVAAEKLLLEAKWELHFELQAAGPAEVRLNPLLRSKSRLLTKIDKLLARWRSKK